MTDLTFVICSSNHCESKQVLCILSRYPLVGQAVNDENGEVNVAFDHDHEPTQPATDTIPAVAKKFKGRGQPWALVVDENYGEGSAREHAALQPRFYGRTIYTLLSACH
jgi:aconitase A